MLRPPLLSAASHNCSSSRRREIREIMKLVAVAFFIAFFITQDKASTLVITSFSYCKSIFNHIHSSGANSHLVQISMLRPFQLMFIPIGWQKLFQAAITTVNNAIATI